MKQNGITKSSPYPLVSPENPRKTSTGPIFSKLYIDSRVDTSCLEAAITLLFLSIFIRARNRWPTVLVFIWTPPRLPPKKQVNCVTHFTAATNNHPGMSWVESYVKFIGSSGSSFHWTLATSIDSNWATKKKTPPTSHYTGWLIGILIMVYANPYING